MKLGTLIERDEQRARDERFVLAGGDPAEASPVQSDGPGNSAWQRAMQLTKP